MGLRIPRLSQNVFRRLRLGPAAQLVRARADRDEGVRPAR